MTDDKKPLESAVELTVYAPIGLALEAKRLLPSFVERGRAQVNMAKVLGQFAVAHGQNQANQRLAKVQAQAETLLGEFGLVTPASDPEPVEAPDAPPSTPEPAPARSGDEARELPIADYDSLAASQVIPRLAGLSAAELEAVRTYELAHRGRKTILGKVAQLQEA